MKSEKLAPESSAPGTRLLSKPEVCDRVGRTFPTIWVWMQQGRFPRARDFNGRPAWFEHEIDEYLANLPVKRLKGDRRTKK